MERSAANTFQRKENRRAVRELRIQQLLDSCREQSLQSIIGPFGLSVAMFDDKQGGSVTTLHNFEQGIVANQSDAQRYQNYSAALDGDLDRTDYDRPLSQVHKKWNQSSDELRSAYTGQVVSKDGKTHAEHVVAVNSIEKQAEAHLYMNRGERVDMASATDNVVPAEARINQSMQDKDKRAWARSENRQDPSRSNADVYGVDRELLTETVERAEAHIQFELLKARLQKDGSELLGTGLEQAKQQALRRAMGVLMYEFVNGMYVEVRTLFMQTENETSLVDQLIQALQRVANRVKDKLSHAFDALISGGIQGFISNLMTYLINCVVTTSAEVVRVIRESMSALWDAVKLLCNPPPNMSAMDVARRVSQLLAGTLAAAIGILFQEGIRSFILSIPLLAPLADFLAPVIAGIITGVGTALLIYGLDKFFDWLSSTGTELLEHRTELLQAHAEVVQQMTDWYVSQYRNAELYNRIACDYGRIEASLECAIATADSAVEQREMALSARQNSIMVMTDGTQTLIEMDEELDMLLTTFFKEEKND